MKSFPIRGAFLLYILLGNSPSLKETKHWYLKLDEFQSFLEDWILKKHKSRFKKG